MSAPGLPHGAKPSHELCRAQASAAAAGVGAPSARPAASGGAGLVGRVTDLGRQVLHTFLHPGQAGRGDAGVPPMVSCDVGECSKQMRTLLRGCTPLHSLLFCLRPYVSA